VMSVRASRQSTALSFRAGGKSATCAHTKPKLILGTHKTTVKTQHTKHTPPRDLCQAASISSSNTERNTSSSAGGEGRGRQLRGQGKTLAGSAGRIASLVGKFSTSLPNHGTSSNTSKGITASYRVSPCANLCGRDEGVRSGGGGGAHNYHHPRQGCPPPPRAEQPARHGVPPAPWFAGSPGT